MSQLEETDEEIKNDFVPKPVVEESIQNSSVPPITGMEVIPRLTPGTRVQRGPDWKWGDQVLRKH